MQPSTTFAILAVIVQFAVADCCWPTADNGNTCADGTEATPWCGYGPCNVFGCACEGGCRTASGAAGAGAKISGAVVDDNTATAKAFAAANVDGTGNLTLAQYTQYIGATDDDTVYVDMFNKHDKNGDGVITLDEILE